MARFIAIPVGQGDSFYLEHNNFSVLVDGGRSRAGFPDLFQRTTRTDHVSVAVCTHNDADHVNGLVGYLDAELGCDEIWLPGRWLGVLPDILMPFMKVFRELIENIAKSKPGQDIGEYDSELSPLESYATNEAGLSTKLDERDKDSPFCDGGWPETMLEMLEQADPWDASWSGHWLFHPDWLVDTCMNFRQLDPRGSRLLGSAIDAAGRIRAIAIKAFHRGIPVRWFEYFPDSPSGGLPELKPVNAREINRVQPLVGTLLYRLALTESNRESLVFWSPPTRQRPGVLFNADSDLKDVCLPSNLYGALATAPHHGSEANANAYVAVANAAQGAYESLTWIRSDGRYQSRPGAAYLGLPGRRLCTLCRLTSKQSTNKQTVHLFSRFGSWAKHRASKKCVCQ